MRAARLAAAVLVGALATAIAAGCGPRADTQTPGRASPSLGGTPSAGGTPSSGVASSSSGLDADRIGLHLEKVAGGLAAPLQVANAGDGSGRLFAVEQGGRVRVVRDGRLVDEPFLDIADRISSGGERGLLGLAFHPRFPTDPRLFVNYTDRDGNTVVASFSVPASQPDTGAVDPATERVLLRITQPFSNHNGGSLAFGPDGFLYIGMGDGGSGGDPDGNGQRLDTLLGKILRINVDAAAPYAIPAENPFAAAGGRPEIWALGVRNPWRFSFDPITGDLWIGDVGQGSWEEVDRIRRGATPPVNLGWNRAEGLHCYPEGSGCDQAGLAAPIAEYGHDQGCSVTGGAVARSRGRGQDALEGIYVFGDYCSGRIWGLDANGPDRQEAVLLLWSGRAISSFGTGEDGTVYVADLALGEVLRLVTR